ncbi:hypothetical protein GGR57DRAFT_517980, partial [Xylariaceae sp. FL1272]
PIIIPVIRASTAFPGVSGVVGGGRRGSAVVAMAVAVAAHTLMDDDAQPTLQDHLLADRDVVLLAWQDPFDDAPPRQDVRQHARALGLLVVLVQRDVVQQLVVNPSPTDLCAMAVRAPRSILHKWDKALGLPRQPAAAWHRERLRDELAEYRAARTTQQRLSETAYVFFTLSRAAYDGFPVRRLPPFATSHVLVYGYMVGKYTSRWLFFSRACFALQILAAFYNERGSQSKQEFQAGRSRYPSSHQPAELQAEGLPTPPVLATISVTSDIWFQTQRKEAVMGQIGQLAIFVPYLCWACHHSMAW